jgi:hypothetical protein
MLLFYRSHHEVALSAGDENHGMLFYQHIRQKDDPLVLRAPLVPSVKS